jgi:hypothetical protein
VEYLSKKKLLRYLYDQLTGNFAGFIVGMSATGLVSRFFETRSIRNLWGITSRKAVVSKETFGALEWIISILIGFIFFEIMTKVLKERLDRNLPAWKRIAFRWIIRKNLHSSENRGSILYENVNSSVRKTLSRFSR